jgi:Mg2+-importing ATPase
LLNNFLYDSSQLAIPFDNVDEDFLLRPKRFDIGFMKKFMFTFGPLSSCFDFLTFGVLLWGFHFVGSGFQTGWFLESIATQTLVVLVIRSRGATAQSVKPARALVASTVGAVAVAWIITYSFLGPNLGFIKFGIVNLAVIALIVIVYLFAVEFAKKAFYRKYGGLIEK